MKIVELYGYSCSGKSYLANEMKYKENLNIKFSIISKKKRILRFLIKIFYIFFIKIDDIIFIQSIHGEFKFYNLKYKLKNFFSFMYLIGFIRKSIRVNQSVVIDHGIFQCLFSCFIFASKKNTNYENISQNLTIFFSKLQINFNYKIICIQTDMETIRSRLNKNKKTFQLSFLENNEEKIKDTYTNLKLVSKFISHKNVNFEFI
tara:strand:+ start:79 stop:690 length:612 start_codon:yes stop_codon:yes gene_type:complete